MRTGMESQLALGYRGDEDESAGECFVTGCKQRSVVAPTAISASISLVDVRPFSAARDLVTPARLMSGAPGLRSSHRSGCDPRQSILLARRFQAELILLRVVTPLRYPVGALSAETRLRRWICIRARSSRLRRIWLTAITRSPDSSTAIPKACPPPRRASLLRAAACSSTMSRSTFRLSRRIGRGLAKLRFGVSIIGPELAAMIVFEFYGGFGRTSAQPLHTKRSQRPPPRIYRSRALRAAEAAAAQFFRYR